MVKDIKNYTPWILTSNWASLGATSEKRDGLKGALSPGPQSPLVCVRGDFLSIGLCLQGSSQKKEKRKTLNYTEPARAIIMQSLANDDCFNICMF